jgi:hypothetical protein
VSRPTQGTANLIQGYVYKIFTSYDMSFQNISTSLKIRISQPYNPSYAET